MIGLDIEHWLWALARLSVAGDARKAEDTLVAAAPERSVADDRIERRVDGRAQRRAAKGALYVERRSHHRDSPRWMTSARVPEPGAPRAEATSAPRAEATTRFVRRRVRAATLTADSELREALR